MIPGGCAQISWHVPYSWGKPRKTSAMRPSNEGAVRPVIASNGVSYLKMTSVGQVNWIWQVNCSNFFLNFYSGAQTLFCIYMSRLYLSSDWVIYTHARIHARRHKRRHRHRHKHLLYHFFLYRHPFSLEFLLRYCCRVFLNSFMRIYRNYDIETESYKKLFQSNIYFKKKGEQYLDRQKILESTEILNQKLFYHLIRGFTKWSPLWYSTFFVLI